MEPAIEESILDVIDVTAREGAYAETWKGLTLEGAYAQRKPLPCQKKATLETDDTKQKSRWKETMFDGTHACHAGRGVHRCFRDTSLPLGGSGPGVPEFIIRSANDLSRYKRDQEQYKL